MMNFFSGLTDWFALLKPKPKVTESKPDLCFWIDRSWKTDYKRHLAVCKELNVKRVGLFLNGLEVNPFKHNTKPFEPFATRDKLFEVVKQYNDVGINCDLTTWIWPHEDYVKRMVDYAQPLLESGCRLDLDSESPWASGFGTALKRDKASKLLYSLVKPELVSVNDYASLQSVTKSLIVPGIRLRPQAYSVGYVNRAGGKVVTTPKSVYWPGVTQKYVMSNKLWGSYKNSHQIDFGLAAYKPISGLSVYEQISRQVNQAMVYKPKEVWFWQMASLNDSYVAGIKKTFSEL